MKNTVNIFEELNKIKNLIHVRRGTVISEQTLSANQQLVSSKGFGSVDKATADILVKLGNITQQSPVFDSSQVSSLRDQARTEVAALRQKNINSNYCSVKDGKIEGANLALKGKTFKSYVDTYKVTRQEVQAAKQTCPDVNVPDPFAPVGPTPLQRFVVSSQSLGIQDPKMDAATLQTILNTLNQGGAGLSESKKSVNEELNTMKYLLGYQRGKVISEQDSATQTSTQNQTASTPKDLIIQIQTVLRDKFKQNLGSTGPDGKWGNYSQTALENALKTISDVSQRRAAETQQTSSQDAVLKSAEAAKPTLPGVSLPTQPGIQQPSK